MLQSLAFIFLLGLLLAALCQKLKLPRIVGMLFTGIVLGPHVLNLLDEKILMVSPDFRETALIIILLKAGLTLNLSELKMVGRPAVLLSFLPATFEIVAFVIFGPMLLKLSLLESALIGAVLGAVSPAVVVPKMIDLIEKGYGTKKGIPHMIMAGSSCDDIYVIVLFSTFLGMLQGKSANIMDFANIPVSIISGIILGAVVGILLSLLFEYLYKKERHVRNSEKVIIVLAASFIMISIENLLKHHIEISGLLAVLSMACTIKIKSAESVCRRLSEKFGKLWLAAEILLFVLVGSAVDIQYTLQAGLAAILIIIISLMFRSLGVYLSILGTNLNAKEKLFCVISNFPKATVQAAIGSVPLTMGLACGPMVLSVAVLSILLTAPLGATLMDLTYKKFLEKN